MSNIPDCRADETYNQKYLNEKDKEYIKGYDYAVEEVLESFFGNIEMYDLSVEGEDIDIGRILENHESILNKLKESMMDYFESSRDEMITSMIDNMDEKEYEEIKASVDSKGE